MSPRPPREYTYKEFSDYARRFNQDKLLTAVAQRAVSLPDDAGEMPYRATPPWALAGLVKASICHGNAYRSTPVRPNDILMGCHMYNNLVTHELHQPGLNSGFNILARIAYEQFPYQESIFEEMARPQLFFSDYSGRKQLEVISEESLTELLGAPVRTAVAVALILYAGAQKNVGFFDPAWLDQPNFTEVLKVVPRERILAVIDSVFVNSIEQFKQQATEAPPLPYLERYLFNPLTARPLLRLRDGRLLAPVLQTIGRKLSPIELYYFGIKRWGEAFARDMGELLEDYIGRQLASMPGVDVHPEVAYIEKRDVLNSIDWIVVFDDLVLLVEAKATRTPAAARAADVTAQGTYQATLGKAFKQINRTYRALQAKVPAFDHIPKDRPMLGLVATLDPWYMANSMAREFLPATDIPTMVASAREVEHLVGIGQRRPVSGVLSEIMRPDDERRTWELSTALGAFDEPADRNPLLDEAWARLPFDDPARQK
jgi:hypothetical protein